MDLAEIINQISKLPKAEIERFLKKLETISFDFEINKSFLNPTYQHPITIKKAVYYFMEIHGVSTTDDATIIFPDGSSSSAYIKDGRTKQRGHYYQIKVRGGLSAISKLKLGEIVSVQIQKINGRIRIQLLKKMEAGWVVSYKV
jgi:hypothetical protein